MDAYSRTVAFLKVVLPLTALGLLSTVFLISSGRNTETRIPFAQKEFEERTKGQQITAPFFSGTSSRGDEIMVTAARARPGTDGSSPDADELSARIRMTDGSEIRLKSDTGILQLDQDVVSFIGNVDVVSSTGVSVNTDRLNSSMTGVFGDSPGPVSGTALFGTLDAGSMQFRAKNEGGPIHMVFNDGVKLIYVPEKPER